MMIFVVAESGGLKMAEIFAGGHLRYQQGAWRDDNGDPVDCVEVVRCKDCKRCYKHITKRHKQTMWLCMRHDLEVCVRPDDFCSYGKRRAEDG